MEDPGLQPQDVRTAAEFVAALRALKEQSGLTYRQLEQRAQAEGQFLARSTLANALSRDQLPREEVVATFLRSCGCGHQQMQAWLEAFERLTSTPAETDSAPTPTDAGSAGDADPTADTGTQADPAGPQPPQGGRLLRRRIGLRLGAGTVLGAIGLGALNLWTDRHGDSTAEEAGSPSASRSSLAKDAPGDSRNVSDAPTASPLPLPPGTYRIRTADGRCLAERRSPGEVGAGTNDFFYQTACTNGSTPVILEEWNNVTYRIKFRGWKRESMRCLGVLKAGIFNGAPATIEYCGQHILNEAELFYFEAVDTNGGGFRLRPAHLDAIPAGQREDLCLGSPEDDDRVWSDIFQMECRPSPRQVFQFQPVLDDGEGS